jgi:hypothetical protein
MHAWSSLHIVRHRFEIRRSFSEDETCLARDAQRENPSPAVLAFRQLRK